VSFDITYMYKKSHYKALARACLRASTTQALRGDARIPFPAVLADSRLFPGKSFASTQKKTPALSKSFIPSRNYRGVRRYTGCLFQQTSRRKIFGVFQALGDPGVGDWGALLFIMHR
jgi:hypothetical protein